MNPNMNLKEKLLACIEDMSQAEQELLLASLTATNGNEVMSMSHEERTEVKDSLVYLAFAALENDVPPKVVFDGAFHLFNQLSNSR